MKFFSKSVSVASQGAKNRRRTKEPTEFIHVEFQGEAYFVSEIRKFLGQVVIIRAVHDGNLYSVAGDHSFVISDEMITCKVNKRENQSWTREKELEKKVNDLSETVHLLKQELEEIKKHVMPTPIGTQRKVIRINNQ